MDLGVATSGPLTREFSAVVIAGFGNELLPLTSNNGVEPCPKALVPVANKPIIDYVLSWIEQAGVKDVLLICPTIHRPMISHHVHSGLSTLHIDVQTYDESIESNTGTCTLLRHFASRISEDFILLPCDFMPPPSLSLNTILNKYRTESLSDGSVATSCWFAAHRPDKNSLVEDWGSIPPLVPIVWDDATGTLLQVDTADDLDRNSEEIELRMSLISQYPRTKLSNCYQDSHVYVCRRSILDLLQEKKHFDSFREEFIPWLCKIQYQRTKREKYGHILNPVTNLVTQDVSLKHSTLRTQAKVYSKNVLHQSNDADASSPFDPESMADSSSLRVGIMLHPTTAGFATRVNNIYSLLDMNRRLLAETTYSLPTDPQNRSLIDPKAQISSDTIIGAFTQISERTTIKKSVVGKHCIVGKMARITGSVLLDHCVIEDGAKVDGCILGKNTKVGTKAELTRCVTQPGYEVSSGESLKNEKLAVSDWTAGPNESEDEEEDEEEEEESEEEEETAEEDSEEEED
ncbi:UDP-3-O-glucosamine N-acyltransferase [Lentinula aciculospora]|uniref:Translation initiation factor eIF2B subunit gamma n=1 Tax=Lentinula aciculospora TaxID=153920 RepID=A0A9W9DVQ2_9AGAR|nr:UDP-3-O-glucosamine N-acyltransferase [Lentinula aciculospora]